MLGGFINSVRALMGLTIQIVPSDEDYSIASHRLDKNLSFNSIRILGCPSSTQGSTKREIDHSRIPFI